MAKERNQNAVKGDVLKLRQFFYNSNNFADVSEVQKVDLYYYDKEEVSETNPKGLRLIQTIDSAAVSHDATGQYSVEVTLDDKYVIGKYTDVWTVVAEPSQAAMPINAVFQVYPNLWYTSPSPIVYEFKFTFRPNKLRAGSKRYLIIEVEPNVPTGSDLAKYYENLAIASPLRISIEQACGPCLPEEQDLRLIVDNEPVDYRDRGRGLYFLDTADLDCGIYNVWFEMEFGGNTYISDKQQLQIY
jgi:hypothetical protein